jgi:hypothetical protein
MCSMNGAKARVNLFALLRRFPILSVHGSHVHDRLAHVGKACHGQLPAILNRIEARDHKRNRREAQCEEGENCQQFLNHVNLRHHRSCQEPPHPLPTAVLALGLHGSPRFLWLRRLAADSCCSHCTVLNGMHSLPS